MTTTEHIESFKANLQSSANHIGRGLSRRALLGTVGVLTVLFLWGMVPRWHANASLLDATRDQRPTVSVVSSQRPEGAANLVLPGSTQAIQEAAIYARTNGYVRKWYTDIGAKVEAGDLLAEIETPEIDQELNQARATAQQAVANAELARATLTRWQELVAKKVVSSQEFDEKKSALDARQADLTAAQANVARLEKLQGFQKVIAPFPGIVTTRNIDNGALVSAGNGGRSFMSRRPTPSESTSPSRKQTRVRLLPNKAPLSHSVKFRKKPSTRKSFALLARSIPPHAHY